MVTFITPVEITPGAASAWTDADVSAYIPSGATGVILHCENQSSSVAIGWRKNGGTDNRTTNITTGGGYWACVGVDVSRILELYCGSITTLNIWLVGYFTSEAVFFANGVDKTIGTATAWTDVNISSDTGSDTALLAFLETNRNGGDVCGFRKNGSTDNRTSSVILHCAATVGVDGSEIYEQWVDILNIDTFLLGYMKSGVTTYTNGTDVSLSTTGAWVDLPALPAGAIGGLYQTIGAVNPNKAGLRKNGASENVLGFTRQSSPLIECDGSQLVEGYIDNTVADFFEAGYFTAVGGSPAFANPFGLLGVGRAA